VTRPFGVELIEGFFLTRDFFVERGKLYDFFDWRSRSERDWEWLVTDTLSIETEEIRGRITLGYFAEPLWIVNAPSVELSKNVNRTITLYELYNSTTSHIVF
jgi:hypothetical protein